ncbi:uncharacterized protein LOC112904802 isoform X2 [Agrilus planipennis]|uniref:Uncharacterized protein LOC112904802 isoform X2 n=1 Tax=Agrilus planipennis TaxID=224129 RepID=A0A7F5R6H5_AGRPL|nr:uncharacterized protein LOC112904802 isoform X2 [Agrilus planipennis]
MAKNVRQEENFDVNHCTKEAASTGNASALMFAPTKEQKNVGFAPEGPSCSYMPTTVIMTPTKDLKAHHLNSASDVEIEHLQGSKTASNSLEGRRIVDIGFLFSQIISMEGHSPFKCSWREFLNERRFGFRSVFQFKCKICNKVDEIFSVQKSNINKAAVLGVLSAGGGYSLLEELCGHMNIPCLSQKTYENCHQDVSTTLHATLWDNIRRAGEEEYRLAVELGEVDSTGIPNIAVVADGAWCKRSYRTNYDASSGVGCIIGKRTGKLLYLGQSKQDKSDGSSSRSR